MIGINILNTILVASLLFSSAASQSNSAYQMWKQCDPLWAHDQLGFSNSDTICSAGCLMTSATMMVTSLPTWINPKDMNQWLRQHGGFVGGNFVWASVQPFGLSFGGLDTVTNRIGLHLLANHFVIANVMGGAHWVLVTGSGSNYYTVNDPGFNTATYGFDQVVQFGWYQRTRLPVKLGSWITNLEQLLGIKDKRNQIATRVQSHEHAQTQELIQKS